ncbi:NAD-dependent DNA ligase LigA [Buchnera aphidicola (Ceratovacuna keduensis)]|uniref:NAD-dependent DNA ligase LigA n=1 Tax=Buchnera aphidicola TaxID=9 RepID=UPI0031B8265F
MKYIENIIKNLRKKIKLYEYFYNVLNVSLVSDYEYDILLKKLLKLEKKFSEYDSDISPTKQIGNNFSEEFKLRNHILPMLSLESVYKISNFYNFYNFIKKKINNDNLKFCCELKIDGVALNVLYKDKLLVHALTRGNGYSGENVTSNISVIKNLPKKLLGKNVPKVLEVRGEVFILKSDFLNLNKNLHNNFKKSFSNTRNIVSGILRRKKKSYIFNEKLFFIVYGVGFVHPNNYFKSHYFMLNKLRSFGFNISKYNNFCKKKCNVISFFKRSLLMKNKIDFDIDGIVIKLDSINLQKKIGYTNKFPKWAIAIKFNTKNILTKILNINFKVGRTGIITPVAKLFPINFSGVIVKNVSLYNKDNIKKLKINIGSYVLVKRSGNVIPKIVKVIYNKNCKNLKKIFFPKICPCCKSNLVLNKNKKLYVCMNGVFCNSQKKKLILHFFSKNGFNVIGIGPKTIEMLINKKMINTPLDMFKLSKKKLFSIKHFKKKTFVNIFNKLKKIKNIYFYNFLYALGIPEIGISVSKNISKKFNSIEEFLCCIRNNNFNKIVNIGIVISKNIYNFFIINNNVKYVLELSKTIKIIF